MDEVKLPDGWFTTKIDDIAEVKGGKRLPKGKALLDTITEHPYVRVTDFEDGSVDISNLKYLDSDTFASIKNYIISKDDLYISIAGTIGLVGEIPDSIDGANLTENAAKICRLTGVQKEYLRYVLNSISAKEQFEDKTTSSGQPKLALFRIKDCTFPLPPKAEQKVIADKLDTLLAQVETTKARLDRIPQILKTFRQSVLAAAVSGKLTEEWRQDNTYIYPYNELSLSDLILEMKNGLSPKPNEEGKGYPILRISSVRPLSVDFSDVRYLETSSKVKELYALKNDDLLFTRYNGSIDFVGVCGRIQIVNDETLLYPDKLIRVRVNPQKITPKYLEIFSATHVTRDYIVSLVKSTSGQKGISGRDLKALKVAVPKINEQNEIVRRVEQLFAHADKIEQQVQAAQQRVNKLTQSILAKAFRGELTSQWRKDNPELISGENSAEALLAKIKAEREAMVKPKRQTRTKKATKSPSKVSQPVVDEKSVLGVIAKHEKVLPQQVFNELKEITSLQEVLSEISRLLEAKDIFEQADNGQNFLVLKQ